MKQNIIHAVIGLIILFAGIKIGSSTASKKYIREFEALRHQTVATEIDLQIKLLTLMSEEKSADANRMLLKWVEENVCELGAYKQRKLFVPNSEIGASVMKAKKYVENKRLAIGECSRQTFTAYSTLLKK